MKRTILCLALAALSAALRAEQIFPKPGWKDAPNPLAGPNAMIGGELCTYSGEYPKSFNYYLNQNTFSADLFGALYDTLLAQHPVSLDYEPSLAEAIAMSDDKRTFTVRLDPKARWSDSRPVTAHDVKWTFDAVLNPSNLTGPHKIFLSRFESPAVLDERRIKFTAREVHWQNLDTLAGLQVLPKHAFEKIDFNKINFEFPVVSGLYRIGEIREGISVTLERRSDWWNRDAARVRHTGNFKTLKYRFFAERENALDAFKKGEIDLFPVYTAHVWVNQTAGERFDRRWIVKQRIVNRNPIGFQGFAMNMRRPLFADARVRRALSHLLDRRRMNETLMHSQYFLHRSYFEDLYSKALPCPNPLVEFDRAQARKLLAEAGWKANPKTQLLEKDGRPFRFRFLTHETSTDKFLVIYREALKDAGIELLIEKKDGAAWARDMDEFNFDMTWAAWSSGVRKDPEPMWLSAEADRPCGHNLAGFKSDKADELIARQRSIFDVGERHAICREIDAILAAETPYILLWNIDSTRLLYWNKFGMPPTVLGKYSDERAASALWWFDEDSAAELADAMKNNQALPARPAEVRFDDVFQEP